MHKITRKKKMSVGSVKGFSLPRVPASLVEDRPTRKAVSHEAFSNLMRKVSAV